MNKVIAEIANERISPILIGGQAAVFHGLCNRSKDWDFVVENTEVVKEEIRKVLRLYSFKYKFVTPGITVPSEPGSLKNRQNLRFTSDHCDIDFVHALDFTRDPQIPYDLGNEMRYNDISRHSALQMVDGTEMLVLNDYAVVLSKMVRAHESDDICRMNYLKRMA
jgi:hypothetical protein